MAQIIDGKKISTQIKDEVKEQVAALKQKGIDVTLAVIQIGKDPASTVYVGNKKKACEYVGIRSLAYELPEETSEQELLELVQSLNAKEDVDGFVSCTPAGIIQLLKRSGIMIDGKECVIIGRSNIVGKPMGMLLLRENGTVTICHSHTPDLKTVAKRADILVVAIGKAKFVDASYVKDGAAVIDVGMDRDENGKLCGDVDFASVEPVAGAITPVPGGVGPMTIAMLMNNCVESAQRKHC